MKPRGGHRSAGMWLVYGLVFVLNAVVFAVAGSPALLVVASVFTGLAALATALAAAAAG